MSLSSQEKAFAPSYKLLWTETIRWVYWRCSSSPFEVTLFCKCNYWAIGWWHDLLVSWIGSSSGEWWKILVLLHFFRNSYVFCVKQSSNKIRYKFWNTWNVRYDCICRYWSCKVPCTMNAQWFLGAQSFPILWNRAHEFPKNVRETTPASFVQAGAGSSSIWRQLLVP